MPGLRPKNIDPSQTEPEVKYFYNVDEKMIIFCTFCEVQYSPSGLLWVGPLVLGGETAQSSRREASTWTFFDRLDIFSNAIDL